MASKVQSSPGWLNRLFLALWSGSPPGSRPILNCAATSRSNQRTGCRANLDSPDARDNEGAPHIAHVAMCGFRHNPTVSGICVERAQARREAALYAPEPGE